MQDIDPDLVVLHPACDAEIAVNWSSVESIAILGGSGEKPLLLSPPLRNRIESECSSGKRVFAEFVGSIGHVYFESPKQTRFDRLVISSADGLAGEPVGSLLDDPCGERIRPYPFTCTKKEPLLAYIISKGHDRIDDDELKHLTEISIFSNTCKKSGE
jgi:hypothetical protein